METRETDQDMFTDLSLLPVFKDEVSPEQQESSLSLVQVKLEPLQIKEEQQESSLSLVQVKLEPPQFKEEQVEELLVRPDGSTLTVQSEDDDNKETAPLARTSTDHMKSQADVEDCGASQPTRDDQLLSTHGSDTDTEDSDEWTSPCPESDIDDSDWEETGEGHSALNKLKSHKTPNVEGLQLSLSNKLSQNLKSSKQTPSMRSHTGSYLKRHMKTDRGVRSQTRVFSCSECPYAFTSQVLLHKHIKKSHNDLYRRMLKDGQITSAACQPITSSVTSQKQVDADKPESYSHQTLPQPEPHQPTCTRKKTHTCKHCGKPFSSLLGLEKHMRVHTGEKPFQCNTCNMSFGWSSNLKTHMRVHTGEKPFQCNACNKSFSVSCALKRHMHVHTGEKTFQCNTCNKSFSESGSLKRHMLIHTGEKPFQCQHCGMSFRYSTCLKSHLCTCHTSEEPVRYQPGRYQCNICDKMYFNLKTHMRTHTGEKPFQCNTCYKSFNELGGLKKHMRTHTGEKPFQCNTCGKNFSDAGHMRRHVRLHAGMDIKPFHCNTCNKRFNRSYNLKLHMHTHTGEAAFHCSLCGKGYSDLKRHMRVHTGEKPFQCNSCNKSFSDKGNLKQHMRTHTGEKPFHCNSCNKSFSESGDLKKHMRVHTEEKSFQCNSCNKSFSEKGNLKQHMRTHTGEKPFHCNSCDKSYSGSSGLKNHQRTHTKGKS